MKKKSIGLIIGLMGFALLGVMAMQLYFLRQSYKMQSDLFDRDVNEALNSVVSKLAKHDADNFINAKARASGTEVSIITSKSNNVTAQGIYITRIKRFKPADRKKYIHDSLEHMSRVLQNEISDAGQAGSFNFRLHFEEYTDEYGTVHHGVIPEIVSNTASQLTKTPLHKYDTLRYDYYIDPQFGKQVIVKTQINPLWQLDQDRKQKLKQYKQIRKMLAADSIKNASSSANEAVFANLAEEYDKSNEPLDKRLNTIWIDSLLRFELHNKGIDLPFSYEVTTAMNDSLIFSKAMDAKGEKPVFLPANTYQTRIFGNEIINDPGVIKLAFPQKNSKILSTMTSTMATSGGLLMVLLLCFGYTIFSILRQKKVSEMKTDFINNMTHEFKTPVSTIMIASEALKDEEIATDKNRIARLANIIYEENARLGSHIERVLNIARIEKNDFKLDVNPLDVNELITDVLDSMSLKLQKYNAKVTLHLDAKDAIIEADELHFSNVLYNLVDNALKYSADSPEITISTASRNQQIIITVADKGIGMGRDQQTKIFEQFYRIPTGNLHDVKGFGLGLSYVNTIVKRLNGTISVKSEKEKGSEFELKFLTA